VTSQLADEDWEKNVEGLTGLARLLQHHPDTVVTEYKNIMQLVLKQVTSSTKRRQSHEESVVFCRRLKTGFILIP
jgi:hypothetical protein